MNKKLLLVDVDALHRAVAAAPLTARYAFPILDAIGIGSASSSQDCRGAALVLRPRDYVTKLVSSVLTCKLPLDGDPVAVHAASPGPSLLAQASDVSDSAFS